MPDMSEAHNVYVVKQRSMMASLGEKTAALSFIEVVTAIFVRGFDPNAAARQCLSKKYLDFGIDAA